MKPILFLSFFLLFSLTGGLIHNRRRHQRRREERGARERGKSGEIERGERERRNTEERRQTEYLITARNESVFLGCNLAESSIIWLKNGEKVENVVSFAREEEGEERKRKVKQIEEENPILGFKHER